MAKPICLDINQIRDNELSSITLQLIFLFLDVSFCTDLYFVYLPKIYN